MDGQTTARGGARAPAAARGRGQRWGAWGSSPGSANRRGAPRGLCAERGRTDTCISPVPSVWTRWWAGRGPGEGGSCAQGPTRHGPRDFSSPVRARAQREPSPTSCGLGEGGAPQIPASAPVPGCPHTWAGSSAPFLSTQARLRGPDAQPLRPPRCTVCTLLG